ncbi:MAG TPA: hypothetical protein VGI12_03895 [Vicinamibacterales bacterium]
MRVAAFVVAALLSIAAGARAQDHDHDASGDRGWTFMQDGVVWVMFNDQGSSRGERELKAPNWWMGMFERPIARGTFTFSLMLSLDPATVGAQGYSHIFQVGETYQGNALIDHQHPHDFLMQAAAIWRTPFLLGTTLTLAGAPVGEPALGPVAFMHRSSAVENPMSPLGHHTLDSTHIAMGVLTGALEKGWFQGEYSLFNAVEPDENRWDLMDPGPLNSWSVRGWLRPSPQWSAQVSYGYLTEPERIEEGDVKRTTASLSWKSSPGARWTSATFAWGRNKKLGGKYDAFLGEATHEFGTSGSIYGRAESTDVEDDVLRSGVHTAGLGRKNLRAHVVLPGGISAVGAVTLGATKTLWRPRGWVAEAGGQLTGYGVPPPLTPFYTAHPWSGQVFLIVRPPAMHRMLDATMTHRPM